MNASPKRSHKQASSKPQAADTGVHRRGRRSDSIENGWTLILRSIRDTDRLGRLIGGTVRGGEVLGLHGPLGAGKTTLVRGIAIGLDADPARVTSPTFVLIHEYRGRLLLVHADLYRLQSDADVSSIGLGEYFNDTAVVAIEWAEKFPSALPADRLDVTLEHRSPRTRRVLLRATGLVSARVLTAIRNRKEVVRSTGGVKSKRVQSGPVRRAHT